MNGFPILSIKKGTVAPMERAIASWNVERISCFTLHVVPGNKEMYIEFNVKGP
jgi:hypothetical protein